MSFPLTFPFGFGGDETSSTDTSTDTATVAVRRLAMFLKEKPNVAGILIALKNETDELTTAFEQILDDTKLENAFGEQLDLIGRIVGQPREAYDDTYYKKLLQARIKINKSAGGAEEIYEIFALILPGSTSMELREYVIASFVLTVSGAISEDDVQFFARILRETKAGGIKAHLTYALVEDTELFGFDAGPQGFDDTNSHFAGTVA